MWPEMGNRIGFETAVATPQDIGLKWGRMPEFHEKQSWAHPVVSDGRLYLRGEQNLHCIGLAEAATR